MKTQNFKSKIIVQPLQILLCLALSCVLADLALAKTVAKSGSSKEKATTESKVESEQPTTSEKASKVFQDPSDQTAKAADDDLEVVFNPMEMRFRIIKIDRGLSRDSRVFNAPRVVTLSAVGPVTQLNEGNWIVKDKNGRRKGVRLAVYHKVAIQTASGEPIFNQVKVGELEIKSVYQTTLQAQVVNDDLSQGLTSRKNGAMIDDARVVMVGDTARLERPIVAPSKPKKRKIIKPKQRPQYERKEMKWRL